MSVDSRSSLLVKNRNSGKFPFKVLISRIAGQVGTSLSDGDMLLAMSQRKFESYPENAPGAFYVQNDLCITCGTPEFFAPDLIGFYGAPSGTNRMSHCQVESGPTGYAVSDSVRATCCHQL